MKKYLEDKENRIVLLISLFTLIVACAPLFTRLCINGHDLEYHLLRIESLKEGILNGRPFLKVNMLFFGGAGYASSMFYPDLLLYIPALLRVCGVSINLSYHIFVAVCVILCYVSAFYCAWGITGSRYGGVFAAVMVTLGSYHLEDIYVRSAVGEYTAFIFIPLVIYGIYNVLCMGMDRPYILGLGFLGLLLCHTGSFVMCIFLCGAVFLIKLRVFINRPALILKVALTALVTAGIGCFYWLPLIEQLLSSEFMVSIPWMKPVDEAGTFFSVFSREFPSVGTGLILFYVLRLFADRKEDGELIGFSDLLYCFGVFFALLSTRLFPWERLGGVMGFIQFPWRFFIAASVLFAFSDGILLYILLKRAGKALSLKEASLCAAAAAGIFLAASLSGLDVMERNAQGFYDYSDDYYSYAPFTANVIAGEWLPVSVKDRDRLIEQSRHAVGDRGQELRFERYKNELTLYAEGAGEYADVPFIYYKGYGAMSGDGQSLKVDGGGSNGLLRVYLNGVSGPVRVWYRGTAAQRLSLVISGFTLLIILTLCVSRQKLRGQRKANEG